MMNNPFIPEEKIHLRLPKQGDKLLFLDFDGVVHPAPIRDIPVLWCDVKQMIGKTIFLEDKVSLITALCRKNGLKIVVSSTWRNHGWSLNQFNQIFEGLIIGKTPELLLKLVNKDIGGREKEIEAYLREIDYKPEYVILDDQADNFFPNNDRVFITHTKTGITAELADQISAFLT